MRTLLLPVLIALLAGCASKDSNEEMTEAEHYQDARESLGNRAFLTAIEKLEDLEARFPYGDFAEQAQLDLIYVRYRSLDYPGAIAQADRFMRTYPDNPALDYVLYIKGLANYYMNAGLFDRVAPSDKSSRDLLPMRQAFNDFDQLARRYPDSEYAPDARSRMVFIRNQLAAQELHAARYYARRKAFIASANRAQQVILHYQGTPSVEEALAILSKSYTALQQPALADKSRRVLAHNWPESDFLEKNQQQVSISWWPREKDSWLSLLTFDLF